MKNRNSSGVIQRKVLVLARFQVSVLLASVALHFRLLERDYLLEFSLDPCLPAVTIISPRSQKHVHL